MVNSAPVPANTESSESPSLTRSSTPSNKREALPNSMAGDGLSGEKILPKFSPLLELTE